MDLEKIKCSNTKIIGKKLNYLEQTESTHIYAKKMINSLIDNGTIIITDNQTNGIGTHGRRWISSKNNNITMSIVLFPKMHLKKLPSNLTIIVAECMKNTIKTLYGINLSIQFPNDLFLKNKKIGGILVETVILNEIVEKLIISVGFNVNEEKFDGISAIATSLKNEYKQQNIPFSPEDIIVEFIQEIEKIFY